MVRLIALISLCIFSYDSIAQDILVKVKEREGLIYSVFFHADYEYDVSIKLLDKGGRSLITDKVYSDGFDKPYNLRNLPAGVYKFQVKYSGEKFEQEISIGAREQEVLSKERVAKTKEPKDKVKRVKMKFPVIIDETEENVKIAVKDPGIESLGVFFYLNDSDEFEYFYWEPTELKEQIYKLSQFDATNLRVEVVEDGKILASKQIARE